MNVRALRKQQTGFTLIELVIVIAIIAILAGIALMKFYNASSPSQQAVCDYNISIGERAYSTYQTMGGTYNPVGQTGAVFLVNAGLLAADLKGGTYTWTQDTSGRVLLTCVPNGGSSAATLFSSSFASAAGIKSLQGTWSVSGGSLVPATSGENRAVLEGTYGTNYDITATVQLTSGNGYGIYYHVTAPQGSAALPTNGNISGYSFQVDPGLGNQFLIRKVTNGSESAPVATAAMPAGFSLTAAHQVTISVVGNSTIVKVDGTQVLSYTDASSSYSAGYVGTRTWSANSVVNFQDVTVVAK